MSGLWVEASWLTERPGDDSWGDHGFGQETREQRRDRYTQKIQDIHGVDHATAVKVLRAAANKYLDPGLAGFASQPRWSVDAHEQLPKSFRNHALWSQAPITDVDLHQPVHATQGWLKCDQMFHNLFHPGKKPPYDDDLVGHPDVDPDDEDDAYWDSGHGDHPAFIRQTDSSHVLLDGHHRVATDMLLGKPTTRGRVLDIHHFGKEGRFRVAAGVLGPRAVADYGPVIT